MSCFPEKIVFLFACWFLTGFSTICAQPSWGEQIEQASLKQLTGSNLPSIQIAVAHRNKLIYQQAFGFADIENQVKATNSTKYRIASISKWLTATTAMRLVEQGKLDLDQEVQFYCPQFPKKKWPITSRDLLTHTSGIRHYRDFESELRNVKSDKERKLIEEQQYRELLSTYQRYTDTQAPLELFKDSPLLFKPASDWHYTSHGYRLIGCVLTGAAGEKYRSLMQSMLFEQFDMSDTLADDAWQIISHRASGYRIEGAESVRRADMRDVSENLPAGGHLSTAADLSLFAQAFFNYNILSKETVELMTKPIMSQHKKAGPKWRNAIPSKGKYGYGVMTFSVDDRIWRGHTGRQAGGSAILVWVPDKELSIAILTNAKGWRGYISFTQEIEAILTNKRLKEIDN